MKIKNIVISAGILLLSGCYADADLETSMSANKTVFHQLPDNGTIFIQNINKEMNKMLSFKSYKKTIENHLQRYHYKTTDNINNADIVAFVSYGEGKTSSLVSVPIFGSTGGGSTTTTGNINGTNFNATSYSMPTWGVVGSRTSSQKLYVRNLAIHMLDKKSLSTENPKVVYELAIESTGSCPLNYVLPHMIDITFLDFPGNNGVPKFIKHVTGSLCEK